MTSRFRSLAIVFCAGGLLCAGIAGPVPLASAANAAGDAAQQPQRQPATTMSYRGAPWLERSEREDEERPDDVLDAMRLRAGDVVADIGVGSGYFARRIARRVGPAGKVYGVDIQPQMLEILEEEAREEGITNIEPILGDPDDPKLPVASVDWMLLVDVYHEISDPAPMLAKMHQALKPDGRVALLEYRLEDASGDHIYADHRMSVRQVLGEWQPAGFELVELLELLPSQHMFIFRKAGRVGDGGTVTQPSLPSVDLLHAVAEGMVTLEARGAGRDAVWLRVHRSVDRDLVLTLPAGTLFEARGECRDMVTVRDAFVLLEDDREDVKVRAAGTRWDLEVPGGDNRFDARAVAADEPLARVARAVQAGTYRAGADAGSVSYGPQTVGTAEAAIWIALHDVSISDVETYLGDAEVASLYAAAFGLVYSERAGIDVTTTRMWKARQAIFGRLQLKQLDEWYRSRLR